MCNPIFCFVLVFLFCPIVLCLQVDFFRSRRTPEVALLKSQKQRSTSNKAVGKPIRPYVKFRIVPPESLELSASESKVLECEAGGNPSPTIHWLKDGHRIPQNMMETIPSTDDGNEDTTPQLGLSFTRSRLFLDCVTAKDEGLYSCVAENPYSRVSSVTELRVVDWKDDENGALCLAKKSFGTPARIHMWTHTRIEMMGSDVQLFCRFDGHPQPEVTWLGPEDNPLEGDKYQILENGDLIIRDIDWSGMGGYTCVAENSHGTDRTLTFLYPAMMGKRKSLA